MIEIYQSHFAIQ